MSEHARLKEAHTHLATSLNLGEPLAAAFAAVARHRFLPPVIRGEGEDTWVDRGHEADAWAQLAYTDAALVTQVDDGAENGPGRPTSSSSAPSVMAAMLEAAGVSRGERVLEIGTGTGYNAAVLSELVGGEGRVTTVEVDDELTESAREDLKASGYAVEVLSGDGAKGHPGGAPFDVVLATCAVTRIPLAWLEQAANGGRIVVPWQPGPGLPAGVLAALRVSGGTANGRFTEPASFMLLRGHRWSGGPPHDLGDDAEVVSTLASDPRELLTGEESCPQLSLMVPAWRWGLRHPSDAEDGEPYVWLSATDVPSWARLHGDGTVEQSGPRRLWDELVAAHRQWEGHGCPAVTDYGLTLTPDGAHRVWLGEPGGPSWQHSRF
ncbi:methyltransferase domain-containing protein [Salinactinospora qingdaonensis]|uniref:Protein-L-isoaspartate O-methyltransferase n=1 Tax=Salinactinospora qingdaonensis TaxID=702744 RepID=A0ABP7G429_9ACTN